MSLPPNPAASGKYDIVRPLGRGGMGEVYLARDTRLNRDVAIKYMRGDLPEGNWQHRLQQEAQLLAQLNHPNIVQIYDIIEQDGVPALVMEYVEGSNLHIYLREHRVELGEKLRWLSEISAGLAASHAAGIAHCDLKAENVLINPQGVAKVTDFGIASNTSDMAGDISALGVLAGQLLQPYSEQLSPSLSDLVYRLQHSKPGKRPGSAEAADGFRLAWHEYTQDETPLPQDVAPLAGKPKALWLVALGGCAAALVLAAYSMLAAPQPHHYVAVVPTQLSAEKGLSPRQRQFMSSTVQQALQQSVIESEPLALISFTEVAGANGTPAEIAAALGADSLMATTMSCSASTCDLSIERLDGNAVLHRRSVTLLVESPLQSYDAVQRQWHHLFPEVVPLQNASQLISDAQYLRYLELHLAAQQFSIPSQRILAELETLLEEANRFLPLYQLYTSVAMMVYEDMGDVVYLDRLERVLEQTDNWDTNSLFLLRSWFDLETKRGDFERAEQIVESVEQEFGDELMITFLKAELHSQKLEHEEAERYYRRAVTLRPSMEFYYARARNLFFSGDAESALTVVDELLARYPYHTGALGMKALVLLERGDLETSIETFQRSLAIQPNPLQRANLGTAYLFQGEYELARDIFQVAYDRDSRDSVMVLNLADAERLLGSTDRAEQLYSSIVERVEADDPSVDLSAAAQAYAQLGQYQAALSLLKAMETEWEGSLEFTFSSALVYSLAGQNIAAVVEIDEALAKGLSPVWFSLPAFDNLCSEDAFRDSIVAAGYSERCETRQH